MYVSRASLFVSNALLRPKYLCVILCNIYTAKGNLILWEDIYTHFFSLHKYSLPLYQEQYSLFLHTDVMTLKFYLDTLYRFSEFGPDRDTHIYSTNTHMILWEVSYNDL